MLPVMGMVNINNIVESATITGVYFTRAILKKWQNGIRAKWLSS